jgi:ADP-heptose:LPS heptosyltransferase/SAM-dependent methyltransferase
MGMVTPIIGAEIVKTAAVSPAVVFDIDSNMPPLSGWLKTKREILIVRRQGGIGDILNSRMIFEDLKKLTGARIVYAIPKQYIPLVIDHPFIDEVVDCDDVEYRQYSYRKDITDQCGKYEASKVPLVDKHRSDIWANYIGYELKSHNYHIRFGHSETNFARQLMAPYKDKIKIAIQPKTSHISKDWEAVKWIRLIAALKKVYDCEVFYFNDKPVNALRGHAHAMVGLPYRRLMAVVNQCDNVIAPAGFMFCLANALHKPTVAIFGCEDLDIYARYFPEAVKIQRHRKNENGWESCPCWSSYLGCKQFGYTDGNKIAECMSDISVAEVVAGFKLCRDHPRRLDGSYYDADYFCTPGVKGRYGKQDFAKDNKFHADIAEMICHVLPIKPKQTILEIGCALGNVGLHLKKYKYWGVDISEYCVNNSHLPGRVRQADIIERIPFLDETVDAIFSRETLEHIDAKFIPKALKEIYRVMKPGAWGLVCPANNFADKEIKKQKDSQNSDISHFCVKPPAWWARQFEQAGFTVDYKRSLQAMALPMPERYTWTMLVIRKS